MTTANPPLPGAMPGRTPENAPQPTDFVPREVAKTRLRATRAATLSTLDRNTGHPFGSLVNVATDAAGRPLILVSRLATHTANLEVDPRASLLLPEMGKGDALAHPRLTVLGSMIQIAPDSAEVPAIRARFLARHPKSELYAGFADFAFWRMEVVSAHLNGGFARAADLTAADVLTDLTDARQMIDVEGEAIAHMNADHADALRLYATKLLGAPDGKWQCVGLSPDGIELQRGQSALWLAFPERVTAPGQLRAVLKQLADEARAH
jgi:heme oxygenase (biliverdin-IX-beta and delta-forming)